MPLLQTCSAVCIVFMVIHPANPVIPSSQVVGIGQEAVFRCQNPTAAAIGWIWNGSEVMVGSPPPGITLGSDTLTIVAQSNYNETEVVCLAFSRSAPAETTPVRLLIQGPLSMVNNIKRTSIITWMAPFSLDLTGVDPDIVYCVEVYNITCGVDDLVVGDCNVTEPRYMDNRLQQGYIYRITITPRSNGQDAQNGTNNTKEEVFMSLIDPKTSVMFRSTSTMVNVVIRFRDDGTGVKPASYFLNLMSVDGTEELPNTPFATSFTQDTNVNSTTLTVSQPLPYRRLWNCQILALGCSEHPVTNLIEISSHDFQNITVSSSIPGEISVTGDFIPGSSAIGILIVVYSANNNITNYYFIHRYSMHMSSLTNLPSGRYEVSVFVMEGNGLPFNRSATTPRNVPLTESGNIQSLFEYHLRYTSSDVCITCTFLESSATDCVAVVHQRISQLSSSGLMNIESSYKFNRSGDTAYGCIEGVNLTDYQIGVFSFEEVRVGPTPSTSPDGVLDIGIIVAIVVVLVIITLLLLATILLIVCCKKGRLSLFQSHPPQSGIVYNSVNLGPPCGVMGHDDDVHKTTALQQEPHEEESFNEEAAAGSADNRCSDGGDATQGGLHLDLSDESVPCCFHSIQGPTMAAELTLLCTEEGSTTCITQCTDAGSTDGQTCLLTLDGKQRNYVQGHLHPVIVKASGVCNGGQHKDITLYTK